MSAKNYVVKESPTLSKPYDRRYIIVDAETGAAFAYKIRKSKDAAKKAKEKHIKNWMKENRSFVELMDTFAFEIAKGSWGPDDKFYAKLVKKMLKEHKLTPDFTAGDLLKVWRKS